MGRPQRKIYLSMKTLPDAREIWQRHTEALRTAVETIAVHEALGRITAEPVRAALSVPHYHGAAMDGIAVRARDTFGAGEVNPKRLILGESAFPVDTGDPLPPETDAVIMVEQIQPVTEREVEIRAAAFPWQHVRKVGEDMVAGELLLPQSHRLRPADLGALLAAGVARVPVRRRPRVWVQPTGTELLAADRAVSARPGQIVEFNGTVLTALVSDCGGEARLREVIPDDYQSLLEMLRQAVRSDADLVLINAGSSAGSEDYTAGLIAELGQVLVHGVTMMPGKPVMLGLVEGKPVIGVPGYPVSAILAFEQFARPLLFSMQGMPTPAEPEATATLGRKLPSRLGLEEFVRVILGRVKDRLVAMPLQRGAGVITSLTRADGLLRIPQEQEGLDLGTAVRVRLLRSADQLDHTLIMIGSHDNTIDLLVNELKRRDSRLHLSSSNVGSLGGLMAIRREQAHLAGSHLLDTATGGYNQSYVERYLKDCPLRLIQLARRQQGLLVAKGNPRGIASIADLTRADLRFVNRQAGSGTRILLDHQLALAGIAADRIQGYDRDEYTHMAVAVAVLSGGADCGMAIHAAARALNLDFIPITEERYDLVVPDWSLNDPKVQMLLEIIETPRFRDLVTALGGYDPSRSGTLEGRWTGSTWAEENR